MRRAAHAAVLAAFAALSVAPAQAVAQTTLAPAGTTKFPDRALRLTVPERRALQAGQLTITENGETVHGASLSSAAGTTATDFGTILVIDASKSMHGAAIERATEAARELARQRTGSQQLGIVVFNRTPTVLLEPTSDQGAIDRALSAPPQLAGQTRIFDAVDTALDLLATAKITAGSIIVLSDGADTGSIAPATAVSTKAKKANVRIYTVGLRSRSFDKGELSGLAQAGQGQYFPAESVDDLGAIFRSLGAQLATEYLIRYRSVTRPGRLVTVAVQIKGTEGFATTTYRVPGGTSFVLVNDSFWTSTLGIITTALLCALMLAIGFAVMIGRRHRRPDVRERVGGFVTTLDNSSPNAELVASREGPGVAERSLEKTQWWASFKEQCEIARIEMDPVRIVLITGFATLFALYVLLKLTADPFFALPALAIPLITRAIVKFKLRQQRRLFADQLPDVLQACASAIRAGHGLTGALAMVTEDAAEPSRTEFLKVVADERLGVPLESALRVVQLRMDSRDVQQIALVAQLQHETGGNMAEVLDRVTESMRRSAELRRMVTSLTAQGRLSGWVVTALPIFLLIFVSLSNPDYVEPLYTTTGGKLMLAGAAALIISGSLVIRKIVDFKV